MSSVAYVVIVTEPDGTRLQHSISRMVGCSDSELLGGTIMRTRGVGALDLFRDRVQRNGRRYRGLRSQPRDDQALQLEEANHACPVAIGLVCVPCATRWRRLYHVWQRRRNPTYLPGWSRRNQCARKRSHAAIRRTIRSLQSPADGQRFPHHVGKRDGSRRIATHWTSSREAPVRFRT
jgi:hypothetical protein